MPDVRRNSESQNEGKGGGVPPFYVFQIVMAELKPPLVIDKSFAHSLPKTLSSLANKFTIIVPSAFYYEESTTAPEKRVRELSDFPSFRRIHLPSLHRIERMTGRAVTSVLIDEANFSDQFVSKSWERTPLIDAILEDYRLSSIEPLFHVWRQILTTKTGFGFSVEELDPVRGNIQEFKCLCEELRSEERIRRVAEQCGWPHAKKLDSTWLHFRIFQEWALQALILLRRYPNPGDVVSEREWENDVLDEQYLVLGLHASGLATAESLRYPKMGWRFRLLEPDKTLITPDRTLI